LVLVTHSVELAQTMPRVFRLQNERLEEGTL